MARPTKTGLDYFPLDVGFLRDKKVRLLRTEFGASSVLFVLYVLGKVYEGDGYFLKWDKDEALIAADELRETPTYISEVLHGCLSRSLFDERVFQVFGVLTSAGIQRRYLRSCEKRDDITVFDEYWLLNVDDKKDVPAGIRAKLTFLQVSGGKNPVNSPGNPVDSPGNPESKVKESKVNTTHTLLKEVLELSGFEVPDHARKAQEAVRDWLTARGFRCKLEYPVDERGDGYTGRIDILAEKDGRYVGMEIDRDTPREKSKHKLMRVDCERVILVRNGSGDAPAVTNEGITVIQMKASHDSAGAAAAPKYQPDWFQRFWSLYPRKANRAAAVKAWDKLRPDRELCGIMSAAIREQMRSAQWQDPQHIPHPSTWLNGERWNDELGPGPAQAPPPRRRGRLEIDENGEEVVVFDD